MGEGLNTITLRLERQTSLERANLHRLYLAQKCEDLALQNQGLRDALQAMRGAFDTPIARRKHGGDFANTARKMAREAMLQPVPAKEPDAR